MTLPRLFRKALPLTAALLAFGTTGCAGLIVNTVAALDAASGTQYYDYSDATDRVLTCRSGAPSPGKVRVYDGISANYRYAYIYNWSRVPIDFTVRWSNGSIDSERVYPGNYSSRYTRWASITANMEWEWNCASR